MEKILRLFLYHNKLKFNEIEKLSGLRSNKVSYYLKKLIEKKIIKKKGEFYSLTESSELLIPYLSEKRAVLPVVLIAIKQGKRIFLYKREKRPYKDKISLPGGRILLGESIKNAVKRIMKEKFNINAALEKINSISMEHVKKDKKIIHTFFLILVSAKTKDKVEYTDVIKNKSKIISSDYNLIQNDLKKEIKIKNIFSRV
ncbi:MAG: NUDIX domain-containing protein [archaeon]